MRRQAPIFHKINPAKLSQLSLLASLQSSTGSNFTIRKCVWPLEWVKTAQELGDHQPQQVAALHALLIILLHSSIHLYRSIQRKQQKIYKRVELISMVSGPGKGTEEYMSNSSSSRYCRILFLGVISSLPIVAKDLFGLSEVVAFGGTSLLIIISVPKELSNWRLSIET